LQRWLSSILVMVVEGTIGSLANLMEVTTEEGVVGEDRATVIAGSPVFLPIVLQ
jgi:hypothetical protein